MPVWWTNRSLPPSSGVMKPKPFSSLNHFTVPVGMSYLRGSCELRSRSTAKGDTCGAEHFVAGPSNGPRSFRAEAYQCAQVFSVANEYPLELPLAAKVAPATVARLMDPSAHRLGSALCVASAIAFGAVAIFGKLAYDAGVGILTL